MLSMVFYDMLCFYADKATKEYTVSAGLFVFVALLAVSPALTKRRVSLSAPRRNVCVNVLL